MTAANIRPARQSDLDRIATLLAGASLPTEGIARHIGTFLVAEKQDTIIGAIGLEDYGHTALLRSAVVEPGHRGTGVGSALYQRLLKVARARGVRRLLLLTTTAEGYFGKKGFATIDAKLVSGAVIQSAEFRGACPESAVCMELLL